MPDTTIITCPKCGEKIPLHDLKEQLTKEMGASMRKEYENKMESERAALKLEAEKDLLKKHQELTKMLMKL